MLDSGVDSSHPSLAGRITGSYRVDGEAGKVRAIARQLFGENNDSFGHGTAVSSIICRVAPNARMVNLAVLNSMNMGVGNALVAALELALERRSRVINMSLAAGVNLAGRLQPLCERAYRQHQIVIASRRNIAPHGYGISSGVLLLHRRGPWKLSVRVSLHVYGLSSDRVHGSRCRGYGGRGVGSERSAVVHFATPAITGICRTFTRRLP